MRIYRSCISTARWNKNIPAIIKTTSLKAFSSKHITSWLIFLELCVSVSMPRVFFYSTHPLLCDLYSGRGLWCRPVWCSHWTIDGTVWGLTLKQNEMVKDKQVADMDFILCPVGCDEGGKARKEQSLLTVTFTADLCCVWLRKIKDHRENRGPCCFCGHLTADLVKLPTKHITQAECFRYSSHHNPNLIRFCGRY